MTDPFKGRALALGGPATDLMPVTPSDTVDLAAVGIALYVANGGDISFVSQAGQTRTVKVYAGAILPVGVRRVLATGTTATGIFAFTLG